MDVGARGWILKTAKQNYWRVKDFYELDDLVQDGFLKFEHVRNRYPNVTSKANLMALFKRAYTNHIHDLARRKAKVRACFDNECDLGFSMERLRYTMMPNTSPTIALLRPELRALFKALLTDPRAAEKLARKLDRTRQTTNDFFCRLIGADPSEINLHSALTDALSEG